MYVELPTKSIFLAFPFNYVPCGFVIFSPDLIGIFLIANHSIITYVLTFYFPSFSRILYIEKIARLAGTILPRGLLSSYKYNTNNRHIINTCISCIYTDIQ